MRVAIFGNTYHDIKSAQTIRLIELLQERGAELCIDSRYYEFLVAHTAIDLPLAELIEGYDFEADVALSIGGDGTFLNTAERVGDKGIPILGINTGRLGFLADVSQEEIEQVVDDLFARDYQVEERSVLQFATESMPSEITHPFALNEITVLKRASSSMIAIHTYINGNFLNTYQADGLIVATPTGSTAYSLSVGGPVIDPQVTGCVITPVAPHSLNVRPLVVNDTTEICLEVESRNHNFLVSVDGRSAMLGSDQRVYIRKADFNIRVVKRNDHLFYDTLRNKLMWGADKRVKVEQQALSRESVNYQS